MTFGSSLTGWACSAAKVVKPFLPPWRARLADLISFMRAVLTALPKIDLHLHCRWRQGAGTAKKSANAAKKFWKLLFKLKDWCATVIRTYSTMAIFT